MIIWFAKLFNKGSRYRITDNEYTRNQAGLVPCIGKIINEIKNEEKQESFQHRFIKLARMTGIGAPMRENHRQRPIADTTIKLTIDKIGKAAKHQADWAGAGNDISKAK